MADGRATIEFLIGRSRLERVDAGSRLESAGAIMERAQLRLKTARAAVGHSDTGGAFASAYDAYRMSAEALLAAQGLRAPGGDGSHVAVEDAVSAQFADVIGAFAKPTFERLRRTRHSAQYFDPDAHEIAVDDATWAIEVAETAVQATVRLLAESPPDEFNG